MKTGIYCIEHIESGRKYIGSAVDFSARWASHRRDLRLAIHDNRYLQNAWNKYGAGAFEFKKLLVCSRENLLMYEQLCIDGYNVCDPVYGFNMAPTAGSCAGRKHSPEAKEKMRVLALRRPRRTLTPETRAKISASNTGKKMSAEAIAKSAAARRGKKVSPTALANIRAAKSTRYKLNFAAAEEIRALYRSGWEQPDIARKYGVTQSTVSYIVTDTIWRRHGVE